MYKKKTSKYFRTSSSSYVVILLFLFFIFLYIILYFVLKKKKKLLAFLCARFPIYNVRRFYVSRVLLRDGGRDRKHIYYYYYSAFDIRLRRRREKWFVIFTIQECSLYNEHAHVVLKSIVKS